MERLTKRYIDFDGNNCVTSSKGNSSVSCMYKLADLEDLEEQGLLLKLPCRPGDTVYRINKGAKKPVISMTVRGIGILYLKTNDLLLEVSCRDDIGGGDTNYFSTDIGKTVFLKQTEAEKALKGQAGAGNS